MHIFRKLASAADKTRCSVKCEPRLRQDASLAGKPVVIVREKTLAAGGHAIALLERLDPVRNIEPKELAKIGADQVSWGLAAKHRRWGQLRSIERGERFCEGVQIGEGRGDEWIRFILAE